ncbi:unnamed protein product [Caretta caretta]
MADAERLGPGPVGAPSATQMEQLASPSERGTTEVSVVPDAMAAAYQEKREELRALEDHRARGAFVRFRIRLFREMDLGSRFFYTLEKRRGAKKHVTCRLADDGTPLMDPEGMHGRARAFYASLFSRDSTDANARRVFWTKLPTVSVGNRDRLELPLSVAKLSEALRRMPTNNSLGMDRLTVEFYCNQL